MDRQTSFPHPGGQTDLWLPTEPQEPQLWTHPQEDELSQQDALQAPSPSLPALVSVPRPSKAGRGLQTPNIPALNPGKGTVSTQGSPQDLLHITKPAGFPRLPGISTPRAGDKGPTQLCSENRSLCSCPRRGPGACHVPPLPKMFRLFPGDCIRRGHLHVPEHEHLPLRSRSRAGHAQPQPSWPAGSRNCPSAATPQHTGPTDPALTACHLQ